MQVLREISSQTAESTTATSRARSASSPSSSAQMRKSVAGFRLPGATRVPRQVSYAGAAADDAPPLPRRPISRRRVERLPARNRTVSLAS